MSRELREAHSARPPRVVRLDIAAVHAPAACRAGPRTSWERCGVREGREPARSSSSRGRCLGGRLRHQALVRLVLLSATLRSSHYARAEPEDAALTKANPPLRVAARTFLRPKRPPSTRSSMKHNKRYTMHTERKLLEPDPPSCSSSPARPSPRSRSRRLPPRRDDPEHLCHRHRERVAVPRRRLGAQRRLHHGRRREVVGREGDVERAEQGEEDGDGLEGGKRLTCGRGDEVRLGSCAGEGEEEEVDGPRQLHEPKWTTSARVSEPSHVMSCSRRRRETTGRTA